MFLRVRAGLWLAQAKQDVLEDVSKDWKLRMPPDESRIAAGECLQKRGEHCLGTSERHPHARTEIPTEWFRSDSSLLPESGQTLSLSSDGNADR